METVQSAGQTLTTKEKPLNNPLYGQYVNLEGFSEFSHICHVLLLLSPLKSETV